MKYRCGFCGYKASQADLCPICLDRTNGAMKSRMAIPIKLDKFTKREKNFHYVQDDIPDFRSPDGALISGRRAWNEHLKRTGSMELGHSDIRSNEEQWAKKRGAFQEKVAKGKDTIKEVEAPEGEIRPYERKPLDVEMANRLYNRPMPDRVTLIKLGLESARRLEKRR